MEHHLAWMPLHRQNRLDPEDRAPVRHHLAELEHVEECRQPSRSDLALPNEGEGVHSGIVPAVTARVSLDVAVARPWVAAEPMIAAVAANVADVMVLAMVAAVAAAMPLLVAMAAMPLLVAMAAAVSCIELRHEFRLLLDVHVDEVAHVVRAYIAELLHPHSAIHGAQNPSELVDLPNAISDNNGLLRADQVQLVQDDFVRECDLLVGLVDLALFNLVVEPAHKVLCVGQGNDCVEPQVHRELGVRHEGAHDWHGVGHAGGLYHDLVDVGPGLDVVQDLLQSIREVAADGAAHAAVVHDHDLLCHGQLRLRQQCVVDRDLAELILDDGDLLLLLLLENEVEQSGLARA
mmetsp:Transcript_101974/g.293676  ORF Transcript_101974/g.293676 Transcript_101974/m.293676 type:complete len:348 (+) Transcript_101974:207-1250(+)